MRHPKALIPRLVRLSEVLASSGCVQAPDVSSLVVQLDATAKAIQSLPPASQVLLVSVLLRHSTGAINNFLDSVEPPKTSPDASRVGSLGAAFGPSN
jgi:hypothetical protein